MKRLITLFFSFVILLGNSAILRADDIAGLRYEDLLPDFNLITPEAASLGKYGSIGCSEYTGIPDISIPLYSVNSGKLSVPVNLYYDASGIKVEQESSFVGLGWNLSYGGCITHIICGNDDFCEFPNESESFCLELLDSIFALQLKGAMSMTDIVNMTTPLNICLNFLPYMILDARILSMPPECFWNVENDSRNVSAEYLLDEISRGYHIPDVFQASFCGHSVSFVLDLVTHEPIIIGDDAIKYKIECIWQNSPYPNGFVITDDQGTVYRFSAYCEYNSRKDSYFLESVTDLTGQDWIKYSYMQGDLAMISQLSFFQSLGKAIKNASLFDSAKKRYVEEHNSWGCETYVMKKVYPTRIETPQETVTFSYEERTDALHGLRVKDITSISKNGTKETHRAELQYDYFYEQNSGGQSTDISTPKVFENARERLKLTGVDVDGKHYGFMYDESHQLPYRTSLSQDFWGYYNGVNNKKKFCATPRYKLLDGELKEVTYVGEANRYCSAEYCKAGVLNRIVYPTGGYTLFDYEVNHFDDPYFFYYTDAKLFNLESNFLKTTMLASTYAIAFRPEKENVYEASFTLDEEMDVNLKYGLQSDGNAACYVRLFDSNNVILLKQETTSQKKESRGTRCCIFQQEPTSSSRIPRIKR